MLPSAARGEHDSPIRDACNVGAGYAYFGQARHGRANSADLDQVWVISASASGRIRTDPSEPDQLGRSLRHFGGIYPGEFDRFGRMSIGKGELRSFSEFSRGSLSILPKCVVLLPPAPVLETRDLSAERRHC